MSQMSRACKRCVREHAGTAHWEGQFYEEKFATEPSCGLVEPIELCLILLRHDLPFDFQRRREFATLWRKIGWRNEKFFDGVIGGQRLIELRDALCEQLVNLGVCGQGL